MLNIKKLSTRLVVICIALALTSGGAFAKSDHSGGGKHKEERYYQEENHHKEWKHHKAEHRELKHYDDRDYDNRDNDRHVSHQVVSFGDNERLVVREYYVNQVSSGNCPPGLAKKNNGCMPPGQAKKWHKGQPLAKEIVYRELPQDLLVRMPPPPPNHRYVQVAGDVLMLAIGSNMVVDAIQDILR